MRLGEFDYFLAQKERTDFSDRLWKALRASNQPTRATNLTRAFNQHCGSRAITVCGARKWLMGEAIPAEKNLLLLAQWLGVTSEWLKYGDKVNAIVKQGIAKGLE